MTPVHRVSLTLEFTDLMTIEKLVKLESYLVEGLEDKEWGNFTIVTTCKMEGFAAPDKKAKKISKEELLELEKKGSKK